MARFRKGTTDHDGDGKRGGSLKAGSRFVKGTNDPDNDGRKGGSLPKGDGMKNRAQGSSKPRAKAAATPSTPERQSSAAKKAVTTPGDEVPEAKATLPERKAAAEKLFAEADAAAAAEAEDNRLRLAVRGF